ncbi:hypothetical protein SDC9_108662 [bioreactor metagenome]|uniref:Uncharacterized protein n=1 Tax=bioreactor metagenome TaxID=1076179 RepID=A0A645B8J5_9ZZZZ
MFLRPKDFLQRFFDSQSVVEGKQKTLKKQKHTLDNDDTKHQLVVQRYNCENALKQNLTSGLFSIIGRIFQ